MTKKENGNGKDTLDEGLIAIHMAFKDAKYLEVAAKECAELMKLGCHRQLELSDAAAMQLYAVVTEGKKVQVERRNTKGEGYLANIESYENLRDFFNGTLEAQTILSPEAANDG